MQVAQSCSLKEARDTVELALTHVGGQTIVSWEDLEHAFPGVKRVPEGTSVIKFLKESNQQSSSLVPNVVLTTSIEPTRVNTPKKGLVDGGHLRADIPVEQERVLDVLEAAQPTKAKDSQQAVAQASRRAYESEVEQRFVSLLTPEAQDAVRTSSNLYEAFGKAIDDGHGELSSTVLKQELKTMMTTNRALQEAVNTKQEEIKRLQDQALSNQKVMKQLQFQYRAQIILTQTYELHEYPIPRLFVVLPEDPARWDSVNVFANKFRLYFLCECGEHTKSTKSSTKIPHHIHLAKHKGYEIAQPSEFFQQYGTYALTILKMLKYGTTSTGAVVPTLPHLISPDVLGQTLDDLKQLQDTIVPGMDHIIRWLDNDEGVEGITGQVENKDSSGRADLSKLKALLICNDIHNVLGNLYKTATDKGHVKWVCEDHYRESYPQTAAIALWRGLQSVGSDFGKGLLDEKNGLVKVRVDSTMSPAPFYFALGEARSVHELDFRLGIGATRINFRELEYALKKSTVSILRLDLQYSWRTYGDAPPSVQEEFDALMRIMEHPRMKVIHIIFSESLNNQPNFASRIPSHLHKLSFGMVPRSCEAGDILRLSAMLKTSTILTTLDLKDCTIGQEGAQALAEALKLNSSLITLNLEGNLIKSEGAQALAEALKVNSTLITLNLSMNSIDYSGAQALAEAFSTNHTLFTLVFDGNLVNRNLISALSEAFKSNSSLANMEPRSRSIRNHRAQSLVEAVEINLHATTLDLNGESIDDDAVQVLAEVLKTNSTLTTLNLQNNWIGSDAAQALAEALKTNSTLTTLELSYTDIGDDGAQALAEALKVNSTLTTLGLSATHIGSDGFQMLAEALKTNSGLVTLNLGLVSLFFTPPCTGAAQAWAEALKVNVTLSELTLTCNLLEDNGIHALAQALTINTSLTRLNLIDSSLNDNGAQVLAEVLKAESTLAMLGLKKNSIGPQGAQALAEALKTNLTLVSLDLESNGIRSSGAQALAEALKSNTALTTLNLKGSGVGKCGAQALAEALKTNTSLISLDLSHTGTGCQGAQALAEALKTNSTLATLDLTYTRVGPNGNQALAEALKTNSRVTILGRSDIGPRKYLMLAEAL
ncbi:hypothetical protein BGZ72_008762 [Mortierella alpina]|nr:hypothetical protein BGZ72_008762 [Mortierella alpina]